MTRLACVAAVAVAVALSGCVPELPAPEVVTTTAPATRAVLEAREALGEDVVIVTTRVLDAARSVADARFTPERGAAQAAALEQAATSASGVDEARAGLAAAIEGLRAEARQSAQVADALDAARELVDVADQAVDGVADEVSAWAPIVAFDRTQDGLVARWDARGSRTEQAEAFTLLEEEASAQQRRSRRLDPEACPQLRTNRIRWAGLVLARTENLAERARAFDGPGFDDLRRRYARAPYGEDRRTADAETRACWEAWSPLTGLADRAESLVAEIEAALQG